MAISIDNIDESKFYNVDEVAKILKISTQTIRRHLRRRILKGKKIGRRWHINGKEIKNFIEN